MKCRDAIAKMQGGNVEAYKLYFGEGCPRFVSPTGPDLEGETDTSMLGYQEQQRVFISEVRRASNAHALHRTQHLRLTLLFKL
jgi:RNA polymerase I-associated factor PAF67